MPKSLSDRVMPWQLAQAGQAVRGQMPLAGLPRLARELPGKQEEAEVELAFGCNEAGRCYVHGYIKARLELICQRCLEPMKWPLNTQVRLGLTAFESELNNWPEGYEPWVVEREEAASLWNLVEDELLLALPIAPCHPVDNCPAGEAFRRAVEEDRRGGMLSDRCPNPFSVLKKDQNKEH